jgi:hypothetical protein
MLSAWAAESDLSVHREHSLHYFGDDCLLLAIAINAFWSGDRVTDT